MNELIKAADKLYTEKKWDAARKAYIHIIDNYIYEVPVSVILKLAIVQRFLKHYEGSEKTLDLGFEKFPNVAGVWIERAALENNQENWSQALPYWRKAHSLAKKFSLLSYQRYALALQQSCLDKNLNDKAKEEICEELKGLIEKAFAIYGKNDKKLKSILDSIRSKKKMSIIAHRGGSGYYVENSLQAFEYAIDKNCEMAELDVHLTKDGEVVVHHNARLHHGYCRKKDGSWLLKNENLTISDMTLSELKEFTIGEVNPESDYASKFPDLTSVKDQHIPTLKEVITLAKEKSKTFKLVIEIKTDILLPSEEYWKRLVDSVLKIVQEENFTERAILCSFQWDALNYAKEKIPAIKTWYTLSPFSWYGKGKVPAIDLPPSQKYLDKFRNFFTKTKSHWYSKDGEINAENIVKEIKKLSGDSVFCYYSDCNDQLIKIVHDNNLNIVAWSVNLRDEKTVNAVNNSNLDGFCTDYL